MRLTYFKGWEAAMKCAFLVLLVLMLAGGQGEPARASLEPPGLEEVADNHCVRCWLYID